MLKLYTKRINAIQWDGEGKTLRYLRGIFGSNHIIHKKFPKGDDVRLWMTGDNSLRMNFKDYQGDPWVEIGDYVIKPNDDSERRFYHYKKESFEKNYHKQSKSKKPC